MSGSTNALIGFNNQADNGSFSNGSWIPSLSLANLQQRQLGVVARTTGLSPAATMFDFNAGLGKLIRCVAIVNHNFNLDSQIRIRGSQDNSFATWDVDTGYKDVWPVVYPFGSVPYEAANWWDRRYSPNDIAGYTPTYIIDLGASYRSQYWRVEVSDPNNPAGYVQLGRSFFGQAWQLAINILAGAGLGWETTTKSQKALSGAQFFAKRTPYRVLRFNTLHSDDDGLSQKFEIDRLMGLDGEVVISMNPQDTVHKLRRQFVGHMRALNPLMFPYYQTTQSAWEIEELVA